MSVGSPRSFFKKFKFKVEVDGFSYFGFSKCSELAMEVGEVPHREGGSLIADKTPGLLTVPNITLERGATKDEEMFEWFKKVVDATKDAGEVDPDYAKDIDIIQQDRDGSTVRRWKVKNAWPRRFVAGEWDNDAEEVVIHSLELVIQHIE